MAIKEIDCRFWCEPLARSGKGDSPTHLVYVSNQASAAAAVTASIHPQAVGWWVLAVLAALVGLAVIGQALGRQSIVEMEPQSCRSGHSNRSKHGSRLPRLQR
jgi:hypothetical protein